MRWQASWVRRESVRSRTRRNAITSRDRVRPQQYRHGGAVRALRPIAIVILALGAAVGAAAQNPTSRTGSRATGPTPTALARTPTTSGGPARDLGTASLKGSLSSVPSAPKVQDHASTATSAAEPDRRAEEPSEPALAAPAATSAAGSGAPSGGAGQGHAELAHPPHDTASPAGAARNSGSRRTWVYLVLVVIGAWAAWGAFGDRIMKRHRSY
jgi:hypothetical protein